MGNEIMEFPGTSLAGATLTDVIRKCCGNPIMDYPGESLAGADLQSADLADTDLAGANLGDADPRSADLTNATGADTYRDAIRKKEKQSCHNNCVK